jgi:hypothetical protein
MADGKNKIFMLGVVHRDAEGPKLLLQWLERIMPRIITLEFTHYGLTFRKKKGREYKKRIREVLTKIKGNNRKYNAETLADLLSYVDVPYEYKVASQYTKKHSGLLYLIDLDVFSYLKLKNSEELFHPANIEKLLCNGGGHRNGNEKAMAKLFFEGGIKTARYTEEMHIRDRYMRDKISILTRSHKDKIFLHICGWQHLEDPHNLYTPLNPEKVFIYDKTVCI